jgi:hypothetical protein
MSKKVQTILSLIEIAENNIKNAKTLLNMMLEEQGKKPFDASIVLTPGKPSADENEAKEVVEGYFDGEYMIGDNGLTYIVPPNYASKTQLVIGDRMKWILTAKREIFKLIQPAEREKLEGVFAIEGDNYLVIVDSLEKPVKILKASATFAIKNHGLQVGDTVSILVPKNTTPSWGALISVIRSGSGNNNIINQEIYPELEKLEIDKLNILDDFESEIISKRKGTKASKVLLDEDYL